MFNSFYLIKIYSIHEGICFEFGMSAFRFHTLFFDYHNGKLGKFGETIEKYDYDFFRSVLYVLYLLTYKKAKKVYEVEGFNHIISNILIEDGKIRINFLSFADNFHIKVLENEFVSLKTYKMQEFSIKSELLKIGLINKIFNRQTELWFFKFKLENIPNIFSFTINLKTIEWAMALIMSMKNKSDLFIDFDPETYEVLDVKLVE